MMTNAQRTYSAAQLKYMAAVAALKVVAKQEDITGDAYCDALDQKMAAQRELFAWSREVVKSDPKTARKFAASAAELDNLFANVWKFPSIREKLTDACLRLVAA